MLPPSPDSLPTALLGWVLGCVFVYAALFGAGSFLEGATTTGVVWLALFLASGAGLTRLLPRLWGRDAAQEAADAVAKAAGAAPGQPVPAGRGEP